MTVSTVEARAIALSLGEAVEAPRRLVERPAPTIPSSAPVTDQLTRAALARADDRVADLGGAIAVFERRPVRRDVGVVRDRLEHVVQLVDEGVAPADDVAGRPPVLPERVV